MTENDYLLAWAAYGIAALGCLLVWFRLTRWMWRWLREPLRVVVAVLLLTPTIVDPVKGLFAPSIAIAALDLLFGVGSNAWRAVSDLALYGTVAAVLYLLLLALRWGLRWRRGPAQTTPEEGAEPTLRELMAGEGGRNPEERSDLRIEPRL